MKSNKQSKIVDVDRELVLVRYATAGDEMRPPKIEVLVNPKDEKHIEVISIRFIRNRCCRNRADVLWSVRRGPENYLSR